MFHLPAEVEEFPSDLRRSMRCCRTLSVGVIVIILRRLGGQHKQGKLFDRKETTALEVFALLRLLGHRDDPRPLPKQNLKTRLIGTAATII